MIVEKLAFRIVSPLNLSYSHANGWNLLVTAQ